MPDKIVIAGHPHMSTGRGEDARGCLRALKAAGLQCEMRDIYDLVDPKDPDLAAELEGSLTKRLSEHTNIYVLNGDEIAQATAHLATDTPSGAYKILYPQWELSKYPAAWKLGVELFDEIWAPSKFVEESLRSTIERPVLHMPLACEPRLTSFLGRKHFSVPEGAFVFLFMFDFSSYMERKNPFAVLDAYSDFRRLNPFSNCRLVIKLNRPGERPAKYLEFTQRAKEMPDDVLVIDRSLTDNEIKNLVRNCDCFISLHRSEGFGRGLAEAMYFGKPVIGTLYSGNLDFMTPDNSCPVGFDLVPVLNDQYPFAEGQVWAAPRLNEAVDWMARLTESRSLCQQIGVAASRQLRQHFSYRASGIRYAARCEQLLYLPMAKNE